MPRLICTAHNSVEGGRLRIYAYRLTNGLADVFTNVSSEAVAAFEARGAVRRGKMIAVSNGIDSSRSLSLSGASGRESLRQSAGLRPTDKLVLAIGRLSEQKDYPNLLAAFAHVRRDRDDVYLWIAGAGDLLPSLTRTAADLGLLECVRFLGVRSDVPALLESADVFVLSSAWEGFGIVVGEAMASEKVVVATDCGGVRELLGNCGYLVPPRNPRALAAALGQALGISPAEAAAMGKRARQRIISHFSLESAVEKWVTIYTDRLPPPGVEDPSSRRTGSTDREQGNGYS
jgi:glycosyltransferase involved in cell wall biosynthesis